MTRSIPHSAFTPQDKVPADVVDRYRIRDWGAGYFGLSTDGKVTVSVDTPSGKVAVALANKNVRTAWAMLTRGESYQRNYQHELPAA